MGGRGTSKPWSYSIKGLVSFKKAFAIISGESSPVTGSFSFPMHLIPAAFTCSSIYG